MLQQVEIFQGLSQEELEALGASSASRSFPKNTVVIHENDPADSLFVIESGKVKVYCSDKNGKHIGCISVQLVRPRKRQPAVPFVNQIWRLSGQHAPFAKQIWR